MVPTLKLALPVLKVAAVAAVAATGVTVGVRHYRHVPAAPVAAPAIVAAPPASPSPSPSPLPSPSIAPQPATAPLPSPSPRDSSGADVLERAKDAYIHGEYDEAIELARQAKAQDPQKAWRVIGASSCFNKDAAGAAEAWSELDVPGKKFIEYVCKRNDVTLHSDVTPPSHVTLPTGVPVL